jgi:hypothetical protein
MARHDHQVWLLPEDPLFAQQSCSLQAAKRCRVDRDGTGFCQ